MKALLDELSAIVAAARERELPLAVIGACALRTYLPSPDRRTSVDADVLTTSGALAAFEALLIERGYRVYSLGPWRRAERDTDRIVVDVAVDAIVDVATFRAYAIAWSTVTERLALPVPRIEDLVAQKLIAAREKDLLDVVLVASEVSIAVDAKVFRDAVEAQDVEIEVARGVLEVDAAVASGRMAEVWRERYGEDAPSGSLEAALARLHQWSKE